MSEEKGAVHFRSQGLGPMSSSLQLLVEAFLYSLLPHHNRVMKISSVFMHVRKDSGWRLTRC